MAGKRRAENWATDKFGFHILVVFHCHWNHGICGFKCLKHGQGMMSGIYSVSAL